MCEILLEAQQMNRNNYNKKVQGVYFFIKYLPAIQTLVGLLCN